MQTNALPTYMDYEPDEKGRQQLWDFIYADRSGTERLRVPPHVQPDVAEQVIQEIVGPDLDVPQTHAAAEVAMFYVLNATVAKFMPLLVRREREMKEIYRALRCLPLIGTLGGEGQLAESADYFDNCLLDHRQFDDMIDALIECYFFLGSGVTDKGLMDRIQKRRDKLGSNVPESTPENDERIRLERYLDVIVPGTKQAKASKAKLLAEQDAFRRAASWARLYIGLESYGGTDWTWWSAFGLMGEVKRSSAESVVAGLQDALAAVSPEKEEQEYVQWARARASRAILFFGGTLPEEQSAWTAEGRVERFQLEG